MGQSLEAAATTAGQVPELALTGDVARPARLTVPDLLTWPQYETDVSFECATSGVQHQTVHRAVAARRAHGRRAPLRPGPAQGPPALPDRRVRRDGHHVLLSWAEIDPDFGQARVLLAVTIDGTPLDRAGPQLLLPQDRCGARHVSGINTPHVDGGYTSWT